MLTSGGGGLSSSPELWKSYCLMSALLTVKGPGGRPGRRCGGYNLSRRMFFFFGLIRSKGSSSLTETCFFCIWNTDRHWQWSKENLKLKLKTSEHEESVTVLKTENQTCRILSCFHRLTFDWSMFHSVTALFLLLPLFNGTNWRIISTYRAAHNS